MAPDVWTIIGVGIALAGLILTTHRATRREIAEVRGEIAEIRGGIAELRGEIAQLRERMAHLEGLLEGLREAITRSRAA